MRKSKIATWLILLLIPLTIFLGSKLPGRSYYLTSTMILLEIMLPFFLAFEGRKPQARELVVIAVLCALAIAGRVVIPIPNFKATYAIIMLSAVAFGPESGFLIGAMTALVSNFFFGQGPHTPWQMMAYGIAGLVVGLAHHEAAETEAHAYGDLRCDSDCGLDRPHSGYLHGIPASVEHYRRRCRCPVCGGPSSEYQSGHCHLPGNPLLGRAFAGKAGSSKSTVRHDGG